MFGSKFNQAKCETTSRLCVQRIRLIRNKKTLQLKQSQKDIAELLRSGKQEYARIRVEGVIREKLLLQAYEILELYLELLTVRTQLIAKTKELPRDMMEAVSSIIYAAQRISDLPELSTLRALFASKYGKEYATEAAADATASRWQVNANLIRCLLVEAPQPEEKLEMLSEIAQEHGVEWDLSTAAREMGVGTGTSAGLLGNTRAHGLNGAPAAAAGAAAPAAAAAGSYPHITPAPVVGGSAQYANAQQAAVAAAAAAAQANAAAQYAAQVASMASSVPHGAHPAVLGNGIASAQQQQQAWQSPPALLMPDMAQHGLPQPPQPSIGGPSGGGGGAAIGRSIPSPPPPPSLHDEAAAAAAVAALPPPPASSDGVSSSGGSVGGYLVRSNSDIRRAYDAAPGPPTKGGAPSVSSSVDAAPPTLPAVAPPLPPPPASAPAPPSPPPEKQQPSAPPPPQALDEYEELTRRLEALKKS
ncbi:hypothetical protein PLESTF_000175600 [Pleodorina starrii]|nr:hypothetical protein PLESTF_000175600 [Pleodorina starrii]